jgi:hypothetical protein
MNATSLLIGGLVAAHALFAPQEPAPQAPPPTPGSLTIYNGDLALVREPLSLDLVAGDNQIAFTRITRRLWPDSVVLQGRAGTGRFAVLQQGYRNDPVSEGFLLSRFEGQTIDFLKEDGSIVRGRIVRSGYVPPPSPGRGWRPMTVAETSPVIEVDGKLRFELPGRPLFPSLGDDTILEPTLLWSLRAERAGRQEFELGYLTGGLSWEADYNVVLPAGEGPAALVGWVTLANESGREFRDVAVQLVAGEVAQNVEAKAEEMFMGAAVRGMADTVQQEAFDAFHLYTLPRALTLRDRESVQVSFLSSDAVAVTNRYLVHSQLGLGDWRFQSMPRTSQMRVDVVREFQNRQDDGLGVPLPMGTLRFYRLDGQGRMQFVGEARIDHTPRDEKVSVSTGRAFDLVAERRTLDYRVDEGRRTSTERIEIELRNRAESAAPVEVIEVLHRWRQSEVVETSDPHRALDASRISFELTLGPGETRKITYTVRYVW